MKETNVNDDFVGLVDGSLEARLRDDYSLFSSVRMNKSYYTRPPFLTRQEERNFKAQSIKEWRKSGIANALIKENLFFGFNDDYLSYYLDEENVKRTNDGRVSDTILRKHDFLINGFWYSKNFDILEKRLSDWHQIKPATPKTSWDNGKIIKYLAPPNKRCSLILPSVPDQIWEAVATKYETPRKKGDSSFWEWVLANPKLPIVITEGTKKVLSLLSQNVIAIGLTGIWNFRRKDEETYTRFLYEELQLFCDKRRRFFVAFDQDKKLKTVKNVNSAIFWLSCLLSQQKKSKVFILSWDGEKGKGVDDFLYYSDNPSRDLDDVIAKGESFNFWASKYHFKLRKPDLKVNSRYLGQDVGKLPNNRLIAVKSPQNTGKTQVISEHIKPFLREGTPVYAFAPIENLAKNLSDRLGIFYRTDNDVLIPYQGYALCVDSLINKRYGLDVNLVDDCVLVFDEIEQLLKHIFFSNTEVRKYAPTILDNLERLCSKASQIIIADADLSNVAIGFFEAMAGQKAYLIENDFKFEGMSFCEVEKADQLFGLINDLIANDEKLFICSTSQKANSQYGTIAIENFISMAYPAKRVLRIDSETTRDPQNEAYRIIEQNIDERLKDYDVVICSPTVATGISIQLKNHFSKVIAFGRGNVSPQSLLQMMWRLRDNIPRYFHTLTTGHDYCGNSSSNPHALLDGNKRKAAFVIRELSILDGRLDDCPPFILDSWSRIGARENASNRCYRELLKFLIEQQGHTLTEIQATPLDKQTIQDNKQICLAVEHGEVLTAENLTIEQVERIEKKSCNKGITQEQRRAIKKAKIKAKYGQISQEILELDDKGMYPQVLLWYYLTVGNGHLKERDKKKVEKLKSDNKNKLFSFDVNRQVLSPTVRILKLFDIEGLIEHFENGESITADDDRIMKLQEKARRYQKDLKEAGCWYSKKQPISTINSLLRLVGFKLKSEKIVSDGRHQKTKTYSLEKPPEIIHKIMAYFLYAENPKVLTMH